VSSDRRRALLVAALGFARLELRGAPEPPALRVLRAWLGSWSALGAIIVGMTRQGYDVDLMTVGPARWQATFLEPNPAGGAPLVAGHAEQAEPWRAVQEAAWRVLNAPRARDLSLTKQALPQGGDGTGARSPSCRA
jgi:hypothetical protein